MSTNFEDLILRDATGNRPAAGVPGRLFYDTTLEKWQRDTGADWEDCEPAAGTVDAGDVTYTPNVDADWDSDTDPGDVNDALDQLAERVDDLEGAGGGGDSSYTDAYASRPAASNDGDLFFPNNSFYIERDTGAAWVPWGPIYPLTAPVSGDFTWVNQESATLVTTPGGMSITAPASAGNDWRILKKAAPSTPYTITVLISLMAYPAQYMSAGLIFMQSSDGKFVTNNGIGYDGNANVVKYTNYNTFSAAYVTWGNLYRSHLMWLRITDDGANRISSYSLDGYNFIQKHTVGRTDFLTADEVGIGLNASESYVAVLNLLSWKQT